MHGAGVDASTCCFPGPQCALLGSALLSPWPIPLSGLIDEFFIPGVCDVQLHSQRTWAPQIMDLSAHLVPTVHKGKLMCMHACNTVQRSQPHRLPSLLFDLLMVQTAGQSPTSCFMLPVDLRAYTATAEA